MCSRIPHSERISTIADLNFLVETWHRVRTNAVPEAIVDRAKSKGLSDYQRLMQGVSKILPRPQARALDDSRLPQFQERGVERHPGSHPERRLRGCGRPDPRQATGILPAGNEHGRQAGSGDFRVQTEPRPGGRFKLEAGTEDGVWDFVRTHMRQLPVFITNEGRAEVIAERQNYLLFDRMVAFHVQRGVTVSLVRCRVLRLAWNNASPRAKGCISCPNRLRCTTRSA